MSTSGIYSLTCDNYEQIVYVAEKYDVNENEYIEYMKIDNEIHVLRYVDTIKPSYSINVTIPTEIDGLTVTTILNGENLDWSFWNANVTIPYTVTHIEGDVFGSPSLVGTTVTVEYNSVNTQDRFDSSVFPYYVDVVYVEVT